MTSAATDARSQRAEIPFQDFYKMAEASGCQLESQENVPFNFRGFCPFHEGDSVKDTRTLQVNSRSNRFNCLYCGARGNALAFFARMWGTTMHDASELAALHNEYGPERPQYPDPATPNNFALLTRAYWHYRDNITRPEPVAYLANLGVHWKQAAEAGIGYAPGDTLYRYLSEDDSVTETELLHSPLFEENGRERMHGRVTITDLDNAAGALQMGSIHPAVPGVAGLWNNRSPVVTSVRFPRRSYLMGNRRIPRNNDLTVITDDARFYIVLATSGFNAVLIMSQRDPESIARNLARHQPRRVAVASHQRDLTLDVLRAVHDLMPGVESARFDRQWVIAALNPQTRNLDELRQFEPEPVPDRPPAAPAPDTRDSAADPPESPPAPDTP